MAPGESGYAVTLDGKAVRTPAGAALELAVEELALAVAEEWRAQGDEILPRTMPITTLSCTAIDRVAPRRGEVMDEALKYAESDLLCYRAETPQELVERQNEHWQPLLDWVSDTYGARLRVTTGIIHVAQPPEAIGALRKALESLDDFELTVMYMVAAASSLAISLALCAGRINADEACTLSHLDEDFQNERWGEDKEAMERRQHINEDIHAAARFLALARGRGE